MEAINVHHDWVPLVAALVTPLLGAWATSYKLYKHAEDDWFKRLAKPSFVPPWWVYVVGWTALYLAMGFASFLIWREGDGFHGAAEKPLIAYGVQLVLNWIWMPIFFGLRRTGLAAIEILLLTVAVGVTAALFREINTLAFQLFIPYLLWTIFDSYVVISMWLMNRNGEKKTTKRKST